MRKVSKKKGHLPLIIIVVLLCIYVGIGYLTYSPSLLETVPDSTKAEAFSEFDPSAAVKCVLHNSMPLYPDINANVTVLGSNVDTSKLGIYTVRYRYGLPGKYNETALNVTVEDTTAPDIQLKFNTDRHYTRLSGYFEEGFTAFDLVDGDITNKVQAEYGTDEVIYTVTDRSGNTATALRKLEFEKSAPVFEKIPGDSVDVPVQGYRNLPHITAEDGWGNDISNRIMVRDGSLSPIAGVYKVDYYLLDENGTEVTYTITVNVKKGASQDVPSGNKVIYLTFDDGPSAYTSKLLNILDDYGVKATFFVTCSHKNYTNMIGEEFRRGHKIAAHTYCHDYDVCYASEDAYYADLSKIEEVIYQQTGQYTNLIRFPGGSSNTVSNICPGLMTRLVLSTADRGYRYFDWNVSSGDGRSKLSTDEVFANVKKGCAGKNTVVLLQHDTKEWSIDAVPMIIEWGLENGYSFETLNESSYQAAHHINN